jgi:hypothetical protein
MFLLVSTAIGSLGTTYEDVSQWVAAVETIHTIVNNILSHPNDPKYFNINVTNPRFEQK